MSGVSSTIDIYARGRVDLVLPSVAGVDNVVSSSLPANFTYLTDLQQFVFESVGANTGAMTLDIGDGHARAIRHLGGSVLAAGDILGADFLVQVYYDVSTDWFHAILIRHPGNLPPAASAAVAATGVSTRFSREDHVHPANMATATPLVAAGTGSVGTSIKPACEDHAHPINPEIATAQTTANNAQTSANSALNSISLLKSPLAIGAYIIGRPIGVTTINPGSTIDGASLYMTGTTNTSGASAFAITTDALSLTGGQTWQCMSRCFGTGSTGYCGLWQRIS